MEGVTHNPNFLWYLGGYALIMILMGIYFSRKISNSEDFVLAGKSLGPVVLMGTLIATWCGSGTVTGGGNSLAYSFGLGPALFFCAEGLIGIGLLSLIAPKIRAYGKYTISGILEDKYGVEAKILSSIIIVLAYVGIVSYQYKGLGYVLNVTTGMSVELGTIISAALMIFLAAIGGLMTVAPTDALSAFIILFSLIVGVPSVLGYAGGWNNVVTSVPETHLNVLGSLSPLQLIGYILPPVFLLLGDQNMYQRLASSKGDKEGKVGSIGWFIGIIIIYPAVAVIAFAARAIFPNIEPGMALISTTTVIPTAIGGLMLAAVAGFVITTGNSYLLSAATSVTYDVYGEYINPNATDKQKLVATKVTIPILGVIAYLLIRYFPTILAVQMYAYTVYAAGITPAVLAVFLWDRVTRAGGISSMVSGVIVTLVWEIILKKPFDVNSIVVSVPTAIIILIIVTLMTSEAKNSPSKKADL
ncbi:sodium:solute symporter family protein [Halanaerobaculum tunisiense]